MTINSYAQNFEDVMLWRALGLVENGFYIDIGAQDPVVDSVSLAFCEHGWRGIHVEPTPHYAEMLRAQRPGDTVIQAAVAEVPGVMQFFEIPDTGISTADPVIAEQHRQRGFEVHEITVPCITLADIYKLAGERDIHWLKIDVEGFESLVLSGWGDSPARPWIIVIESTLPMTQIETYENWESIVINYGYTPVYFDGLNRYYISDAHPEIKDAFRSPPNVFDGFTLNGTSTAPFQQMIENRWKARLNEAVAQLEEQRLTAKKEVEDFKQQLEARERIFAASEQTLTEQLRMEQEQLRDLEQERSVRELERADQFNQIRQEVETLLRAQTQREQEFAQQLLKGQQETEQVWREHEQALRTEHAGREAALVEQLREKEKDLQRLEESWSEQQRALTQELTQLREQQHQEREGLLNAQLRREQEFAVKQLALQQEAEGKLERSRAEQVAREAVYGKRIAETQLQLESMLRTFVQREQEFSQQLLKLQHEAEETRRAAEQSWFEQQSLLSQELVQIKERQRQEDAEHDRRETLLIEKLHEQNKEHCRLEQSWTEQKKTLRQELSALQEKLNSEILRRHEELQAAENVRHLQAEQYDRDLAVKESEHQQRLQALNAITVKLHEQLQREREALGRIRTSLLWRITTPLRALASIFATSPSSDPSLQLFEPQYLADINRLLAGNPIANVHSELREFIVPSPSQPDTVTTVAATLDELLTLQDRAFVQCAYLTLLGRAADSEGLQYYVGRLRQGISKIQILTQLRCSAEGKKHSGNLPGLDAAIKRYQSTQTPLMRWLTKLINSILHNAEASAQMRRIESQLLILNKETSRRFQQIDASLGEERHVNPQTLTATSVADPQPSDIVRTAEPEGFKNLSPRAREIYFQLKKATATFDAGRAA